MSKSVVFHDIGEVVFVQEKGNYGIGDPKVVEKESANFKARMACLLVERWGMVAAVEDGNDPQGRAKLRTMTPEEVVARACETADRMVDKIRALGWMQKNPTAEELYGLPGEQE